jgi:hypothetical protein
MALEVGSEPQDLCSVEEFFLLDLGGVKKRVAEEMRIEKSNQV